MDSRIKDLKQLYITSKTVAFNEGPHQHILMPVTLVLQEKMGEEVLLSNYKMYSTLDKMISVDYSTLIREVKHPHFSNHVSIEAKVKSQQELYAIFEDEMKRIELEGEEKVERYRKEESERKLLVSDDKINTSHFVGC